MASDGTEIELLKGGMSQTDVAKPEWVQNLWKPRGSDSWQVRPGFGQRSQLDTTLLQGNASSYGITEHIGSTLIQTDFGHEQIVSVFLLEADTADSSGINNLYLKLYSVIIYDLETDQYWEEIVHQHTSEMITATLPMDQWSATYETNEDQDTQEWVAGTDSPFYFQFFSGVLFLGNDRTGLWAYHPADFRGNRSKQTENSQKLDYAVGYGETSLLNPVVPVDGIFSTAYVYLDSSTFPKVRAMGALMGRLVIANNREIYFSDQNKANQFMAVNFLTLPSENDITAMAEINGNLLIFTKTETFFYQPSPAPIVSQGNLQMVSNSVGCISDSTVTTRGNSVLWVDRNGVYATTNGLNFKLLSEPIDDFFNGSITSPLNAYFTDTGTTDLSLTQPRTLYKYDPEDQVHIAYHEETNSVVVSFGALNAVWYYNGEWSLWPTESMVSVDTLGAARVGVTSKVDNPWALSGKDRIYLVTGIEAQSIVTVDTSSPTYSRSYQILELGRGGALDRSIEDEDERVFRHLQDFKPGTTTTGLRAYVNHPRIDANGDYELQIDLVTTSVVERPDHVDIIFSFDNTRWTPKVSGGAILDIEMPTERILTIDGFSLGGPTGGTTEAQVYDGVNPDATGDKIVLRWDAGASSVADLLMTKDNRNPFVIIKMTPAAPTSSITGYAINTVTVTTKSGLTVENGQMIVDQILRTDQRHKDDDVAQPVDWAYKGSQIGIDEAKQVRSRGLYSQLLSHGAGTTPLIANWTWGLFNVLMGSDWKDWTTQVIDTTGDITYQTGKSTLRTRAADSSAVLKKRTFNNNLKYGSYLVDDEEYNVNAVSLSVKGKYLSQMAFGFVMNRAEKLVLGSMKAVVKAAGGRRRIGR